MTSLRTRHQQATLLDLLDRLLDKGVVVAGDLTLSVANVDLLFASLRLVVTSVDKAWETKPIASPNGGPPEPTGDGGSSLRPETSPGEGGDRRDSDPLKSRLPATTRDHGSTARDLSALPSSEHRVDAEDRAFDPDKAVNGVAQLAVTIVELLHKLLEREALRRMDRGTLAAGEVERLGQAFLRLDEKVQEIKEVFDLRDEDLNLDLGPLGKLM